MVMVVIAVVIVVLLGLSIFYYGRSCRKLQDVIETYWNTIARVYGERLNQVYVLYNDAVQGGKTEAAQKIERVMNNIAYALKNHTPVNLRLSDDAVTSIVVPLASSASLGDGGFSVDSFYTRTRKELLEAVEGYNSAVLEYRNYSKNWHKLLRLLRQEPHEWVMFEGYETENVRAQ